ncbi:MAG: type I restriction enzyme HsdR N-terminal domain-containing protein [Bacteroidales bacterium]|nr:type I restriction enzyme HsdR N-terminal domain-containing protein [Bacteroidales bacterium]
MPFPKLNLPPCRLTLRDDKVLDVLRHRFVALTPEEWVRQHVEHLLTEVMHYPKELVQAEGTISVNGLARRCDIVVHRKAEEGLQPVMIVECKAHSVPLSQKVLDQASRYNLSLHVPYLFLTNGMKHLLLRVDEERRQLVQIAEFPTWEELVGQMSF